MIERREIWHHLNGAPFAIRRLVTALPLIEGSAYGIQFKERRVLADRRSNPCECGHRMFDHEDFDGNIRECNYRGCSCEQFLDRRDFDRRRAMTQERRAARFSLSPKTLKEALHMPDESEVYGVEWSFSDRMIYVYVNDPSFQLIPEGCSVPLATLVLTEPEFPDGVITGEWK